MLTFLVIIGVAVVVVSAGITLVACAASARLSEHEDWSEEPLVAHPAGQPIRQTTTTSR
ncbi:MAG: hypothetical protein KA764_17680 [Anaerolineales bacterium]|nr:hypothetical protein [Anaerolineales bacterium]